MKAKRIAALIMAIAVALSLCMSASAATAVKTVYPCITLEKGGTITVSSLVSPSDTTEKITFSSSDKKIITVSSAGKVTAVAKGTAYVKYTSSNTKKTARLYVKVTETASSSKTNNPSADTIIAAISGITGIEAVKAVTEDNDPNEQLGKQGGYTGAVFFSVKSITDVEGVDSIEKGTDGGGCIEIYSSSSDAKKRDEYLANFDGGIFSSGSHKIVGTLVIRTSSKLKASEQQSLEQKIIDTLK